MGIENDTWDCEEMAIDSSLCGGKDDHKAVSGTIREVSAHGMSRAIVLAIEELRGSACLLSCCRRHLSTVNTNSADIDRPMKFFILRIRSYRRSST